MGVQAVAALLGAASMATSRHLTSVWCPTASSSATAQLVRPAATDVSVLSRTTGRIASTHAGGNRFSALERGVDA